MAIRPPSRTTQLEDLPPEDSGPTPDELVDFGGETTQAFMVRTGTAEPRPLAASDAVPVFRTDLRIEKGASAGLFEVAEPDTGRHFTLYEFELSIARMLDGRRHASDVIENGVRLGIPVELDGLNKFVRQLWRYGFLASPAAAAGQAEGEESGWGEREKWDEATRTLFQTGLRLMRQGRPQDARSYFDAVLDADPGNAEAKELLAAIERGESLVARPLGSRSPAARPAPPRRRWTAPAVVAISLVAVAAAAFGVAHRRPARPAPPPVAAPTPRPPQWRTAAVESRVHPRVGELTADDRGTVLWRSRAGARVAPGERIGVLRRAGAPRRELPLVAPAEGTLALEVPDRARVAAGAVLASVSDDRLWIVEAFLDGEPPPRDAACELRGDSLAERIACGIEEVKVRDGGSGLRLTVKADDAPWLSASRSLRVRVAPPLGAR